MHWLDWRTTDCLLHSFFRLLGNHICFFLFDMRSVWVAFLRHLLWFLTKTEFQVLRCVDLLNFWGREVLVTPVNIAGDSLVHLARLRP